MGGERRTFETLDVKEWNVNRFHDRFKADGLSVTWRLRTDE